MTLFGCLHHSTRNLKVASSLMYILPQELPIGIYVRRDKWLNTEFCPVCIESIYRDIRTKKFLHLDIFHAVIEKYLHTSIGFP